MRRIDVGTVRLSVQWWESETPTRPTAVLLPAMGETASDWHQIATALSRDRAVVAVDLRGHGESDWPGTYSIELMAGDIRGLLAVLDEPVDLIGHSLGGFVAWCVAAGGSGAVRRLVLEEAALLRPRQPVTPARPTGRLDFDWAVVEQVRREIDVPDPYWPARAASVAAPSLVIGGGETSPVPQQHVADLAHAIPDGRLATIESGHLVHAVEPQQFLAEIRAFLDR